MLYNPGLRCADLRLLFGSSLGAAHEDFQWLAAHPGNEHSNSAAAPLSVPELLASSHTPKHVCGKCCVLVETTEARLPSTTRVSNRSWLETRADRIVDTATSRLAAAATGGMSHLRGCLILQGRQRY